MSFGLSTFFGSTPRVAKYKPISPQDEQQKAVAGNIAAFPDISNLSDLYSTEQQGQLSKILGPDWEKNLTAGQAATNLLYGQGTSLLEGQLPQSWLDQVQQSSAYQNLRSGTLGSPMASAADIGRIVTGGYIPAAQLGASLIGQGTNSMQNWNTIAKSQTMEPGSMLLTPTQQYSADAAEKARQYQAIQNSYNVQAQPNPGASGAFNSVMQVLGEVLSIYGGGGGWKNIGGQGGSGSVNFNQGMYGTSQNPGYFNPGYSQDVATYG